MPTREKEERPKRAFYFCLRPAFETVVRRTRRGIFADGGGSDTHSVASVHSAVKKMFSLFRENSMKVVWLSHKTMIEGMQDRSAALWKTLEDNRAALLKALKESRVALLKSLGDISRVALVEALQT